VHPATTEPVGEFVTDETINLKRSYLSLLPPVQLIELLLAIDADRSNHNLPIFPPNIPDAIKHLQAARQAYPHMYAHPYYYAHVPPSKSASGTNIQASKQPNWAANAAKTKPEPEAVKAVKSTHTPQPMTTQPSADNSTQPSSSASAATSAALARAALAASESRNSDDLPSYEEMIVEAITEMNEPDGTPPKVLFAWMAA
jgi:hypothetical protein